VCVLEWRCETCGHLAEAPDAYDGRAAPSLAFHLQDMDADGGFQSIQVSAVQSCHFVGNCFALIACKKVTHGLTDDVFHQPSTLALPPPVLLLRRLVIDLLLQLLPPHPNLYPPQAVAMAPSGAGERDACYCPSCTVDGRSGPNSVCRSPLFNHRQREKRRRLEYGGHGGGPANALLRNGGVEGPPAGNGLSVPSGGQAGQPPGDDGAGAQEAVEADRRRCDADETPNASVVSSDSSSNDESDGSDGSNDVPPPDINADPKPEDQIGASPIPTYQPTVSTNEGRLTVGQ